MFFFRIVYIWMINRNFNRRSHYIHFNYTMKLRLILFFLYDFLIIKINSIILLFYTYTDILIIIYVGNWILSIAGRNKEQFCKILAIASSNFALQRPTNLFRSIFAKKVLFLHGISKRFKPEVIEMFNCKN